MEDQKKKRGENWSTEEKEILREIIGRSASLLESKSTKTANNLRKANEWKNITKSFNEITGKNRSNGEIKLAWKRMKMIAKANLGAHRRALQQTGGGQQPPSPSPEDLEVVAIAPHDFVVEENDFDSDAVIPIKTIHEMAGLSSQLDENSDTTAGPSSSQIHEIPVTTTTVAGQTPIAISYALTYPMTVPTATVEISAGPSSQSRIDDNPEIQGSSYILNQVKNNTKRTITKTSKQKSQIRNEELKKAIVDSNQNFKSQQLEMLKIEHEYNVQIAKLKIEKLQLEISLLKKEKSEKLINNSR